MLKSSTFLHVLCQPRGLANQKPNGPAYAINETNPDCVVAGEGQLLNFEVLEKALKLIIKGSKLLAINLVPTAQLTVEFD
ncbi:MAG: hypothetical protein VX677_05975 [Candidatus Poribacteria bacterium]|nr:hypothetical protein [Candidatus Poribacteria bacterium]